MMTMDIRSLRQQQGLKQKILAQMAGVTVHDLSTWERGLKLPNEQQFQALATALCYDMASLKQGQFTYNSTVTPGEGYTTKKSSKELILTRVQPVNRADLKVIDLFCGAGGLSYGFSKVKGFQVTGGIDLLEDRVSTFQANHPQANGIIADIRTFPLDTLSALADNPDIVVGGTPCQGFSSIRPFRTLTEEDTRNSLLETFILAIAHLKPTWFIFENVVGLLTHKKGSILQSILTEFEYIGYKLDWKIINAAYYGLPQTRERLILVGNKVGKQFKWPRPTYYVDHKSMAGTRPEVIVPSPLFDKPLQAAITVMEAIHDLPELASGETNNTYRPDIEPTQYESELRDGCAAPALHQATEHSEKMLEIIRLAGPNRNALPDGLTSSGFSSSYSRLIANKPCTTITVNFVHPASNRCIHPTQDRALSIQEGARLQGFPDAYRFQGTRAQIVKQIGNAVSPLLSEVLAKAITKHL